MDQRKTYQTLGQQNSAEDARREGKTLPGSYYSERARELQEKPHYRLHLQTHLLTRKRPCGSPKYRMRLTFNLSDDLKPC